jgi:hypothetical protein
MRPVLQTRRNGGATLRETAPGSEDASGRWWLEIPAGPAGVYRLAQLDDHLHQARKDFAWRAPLRLDVRARVSEPDLPGTWGFGLWNDPFSASFGVSGTARRLPALPNAAWFFFAGRPNFLAFRDTHPAQGFLAGTFSSPHLPALLLAPGLLAAPGIFLPPFARLLRRVVRWFIQEDAAALSVDPTGWHDYRMDWQAQQVSFWVDEVPVFSTPVAPRGPLGLAIWIDNQYAAFPPSGKVRAGTSPNPLPAWLEIEVVSIKAIEAQPE